MSIKEDAIKLSGSGVWDELIESSRLSIYYDWRNSTSPEEREEIFRRLEGVIIMENRLAVLCEGELNNGA